MTFREGTAFLIDENTPPQLGAALLREAPDVRVYLVGHDPAPPRGTPDPELLRWIEAIGCLLVTNNRRSLPGHLRDHLAGGGHVPGILVIRPRLTVWRPLLADLLLIAGAAAPDEHQDRIVYIPSDAVGERWSCAAAASRRGRAGRRQGKTTATAAFGAPNSR